MNTVHETLYFSQWLENLRDLKGKARIMARINMAKAGNFGEYKVLDEGVCEMKIDFGPGYRVYYAQEGLHLYLLISGGDKASQKKDMVKAREMWRVLKQENSGK